MTAKSTSSENPKTPDPKTLGGEIWSWVKYFASLIAIFLGLTTFVFGHFKIPSESMQPTLEVGDHIYVSKWAYGYSRHALPFGLHKLVGWDGKIFSRVPKRGDVAVFRGQCQDHDNFEDTPEICDETILIKRVVGLPGDRLTFLNGRVYINGDLVDREFSNAFVYREHPKYEGPGPVIGATEYVEQFPDEKTSHLIWERGDERGFDNSGEFIVPEEHVFFIGDNRDNSGDSRAPRGPRYVPLKHLIGRADMMVFSFKKCEAEDNLRCPGRRWFQGL